MKKLIQIKFVLSTLICCLFTSCEDFLEVESPDNKMVSEVVFGNDETAISVMTGIYNQLFNASFSNGAGDSVTVLAGLSGDDLTTIRTTNLPFIEFDQHEILPSNSRNYNLWSSAYYIIYMSNSLLEGIASSPNISDKIRSQLEGEAKFIRAFCYFYLVNLYGEVPLILTTDYSENALASRDSEEKVYQQILADLQTAKDLLNNNYSRGERTQVTRYTALALMARVHLYLQNWVKAETLSSEIIAGDDTYEILEDLDQVFLANSREAIWQLSPIGRGNTITSTNEGLVFIIPNSFLAALSHLKLPLNFVNSYEAYDKRVSHWINFHDGLSAYFPYKYKIRNSTQPISEYSMVFRLAEQYLIRAEARVMQNDIAGAIEDLDKIRSRAGLELIADTFPEVAQENLFHLILEERKRELFTEWGHRWLDLKRTSKASEVLGVDNPLWQDTDKLYPIPEGDRIRNPNLSQNNGY